ncbi:signal transduction histidine kinase [Fervidobacterium pennivorans DSM 9078]|uniref:histidine kinase n=1 Tax=Fervidobacterium pennivorans (strain DSM 9078 / Ven5) TaxID=771875 RepID=H9UEN8_FERPD|nr:HAMP domain-containing sensor histidine kinase [Fervidobacterium pennivorans]AFG35981.1 signal transduction histidine kinase [Fervidobacterium pennivorans DSM 9078]
MRDKNKKGKTDRIYLVINIVILVIITILFVWYATNYYSSWKKQMETFMKNVAVSLSYPAWTYDKRVIEQLAAVVIEKEEIVSVVIYDDKNDKLAVKEKESKLTTFDLLFGTKRFVRVFSLIYADTYVGKVIFTYTDNSARKFLVVTGTGAVLFYIVSFLLASNVKKNKELAAMVDELNELNAELEAAFNELEETQNKIINAEKMAALGKLMVNIAHDINTPAGIIYSSLTEQQNRLVNVVKKFEADELTEEEFKSCVDTILELTQIMLRNARRIIELVQSLKRTALNEMVQTWSEINVKSVVNDVLNAMHPRLRKTKIEVVTEIDDNLVVYTIPGAIAQILMNLIDNAIVHAFEYDNPGKIMIRCEKIKSQSDKEYLLLTFSDNGKGMDEETKKRAFEPFYTTDKESGTGLGLSIVYSLVVDVLSGDIELESEIGKGTTLRIKIPLTKKNG